MLGKLSSCRRHSHSENIIRYFTEYNITLIILTGLVNCVYNGNDICVGGYREND